MHTLLAGQRLGITCQWRESTAAAATLGMTLRLDPSLFRWTRLLPRAIYLFVTVHALELSTCHLSLNVNWNLFVFWTSFLTECELEPSVQFSAECALELSVHRLSQNICWNFLHTIYHKIYTGIFCIPFISKYALELSRYHLSQNMH